MAVYSNDFEEILKKYDLLENELDTNTIYAIKPDFTIAYLNSGWFKFSKENQGEPEISANWGLGKNIIDAFSYEIKDYFVANYDDCLKNNKEWAHEYECSTAEKFRKFYQKVYPLKEKGLLIVNTKIIEYPHPENKSPLPKFEDAEFIDKNGIAHQCCHCRKLQSVKDESRWYWVPEWLNNPKATTSHGICPLCIGHYYNITKQ